MTIDEAIKVLRQHNVKGASVLRITRGQVLEKELLAQVLDSCEQLIYEKTEYKRLLKAAVESFDKLKEAVIPFHSIVCDYAMQFANPYDACNSCPLCNARYKTCKWKGTDEAMKLMGE